MNHPGVPLLQSTAQKNIEFLMQLSNYTFHVDYLFKFYNKMHLKNSLFGFSSDNYCLFIEERNLSYCCVCDTVEAECLMKIQKVDSSNAFYYRI